MSLVIVFVSVVKLVKTNKQEEALLQMFTEKVRLCEYESVAVTEC